MERPRRSQVCVNKSLKGGGKPEQAFHTSTSIAAVSGFFKLAFDAKTVAIRLRQCTGRSRV